jgi:hypothetical protein
MGVRIVPCAFCPPRVSVRPVGRRIGVECFWLPGVTGDAQTFCQRGVESCLDAGDLGLGFEQVRVFDVECVNSSAFQVTSVMCCWCPKSPALLKVFWYPMTWRFPS